ncbi:unnamed protein product [Diatraea saccharalis]|uniref:Major facilitator superfamily associated domain-containing protein n=1 Tax=Diatraea saccharalis TaxID=40085 RepID=A0A9P0G2W4_9NEOP|nr:unnamed protein product [Diatraea saccharalis]
MKLKIDRRLLPIKAHFFFFFAALGPVLPQLNVFGRQLGVSPAVMGMVTAVLPLLWATAKPLFGYVVDYWPTHRKLIFMLLIAVMTGSYCCLWFLPMPETPETEPAIIKTVYNLNDTIHLGTIDDSTLNRYSCHWNCTKLQKFYMYLPNETLVNTIFVDGNVTPESCSHFDMDAGNGPGVTCALKPNCSLLCFEDDLDMNATVVDRTRRDISNVTNDSRIVVDDAKGGMSLKHVFSQVTKVTHSKVDSESDERNFYMTSTFWAFVILMCVGTVAFNVANCIGDAVCFDVLGTEKASKYGAQRAWGTAGYGITALLGGVLVDAVSRGASKDFTPAFVIALAATAVDLYSCRALTVSTFLAKTEGVITLQ